MNDELLGECGCMDCIHDDEEDHTESCYICSWLMGEGKGYPCLFQPKDEPVNLTADAIRTVGGKEENLCGNGRT